MSGTEFEGYEALVSELRANPPVASEHLRQRVLEGAPVPRRQRSRKRKLVLVVVPAALVLSVGAALVHGFVSSGSNGNSTALEPILRQAVTHAPGRYSPGTKTTPEAAVGSGSVVRGQIQSKSKTVFRAYQDDSPGVPLSGVAAAPDALQALGPNRALTIPRNRLVHATASLQVGVKSKDLSAKTNEASQIAASFGGYANSVHYEASKQGDGEAVLSLRVPVQNAEKALAKLEGLGTVLSQQVSTQDLQAKLTQQTSGIGSLRRAIAVYDKALESTTLPASQRVDIQIKLNNARRALARLRHARVGTLASGATADISLLLTTNSHAVVPGHHGGSTRIGRLLGNAAHFLALEGIIVLYALIVLAPFLLLGALAWWIVRERRRREERLLSTA
jgi:Domain of unknown function (DUF4349)